MYIRMAVALVVLALSAAVYVQTTRLSAAKAEFKTYRVEVEAAGRAALAEVELREQLALLNKETNDAENARRTAALNRHIARLRDDVASRGALPEVRPGAERPDLATFDRAELDRALREFIGEAAEIAGVGAAAVKDLDTAKVWAAGRAK